MMKKFLASLVLLTFLLIPPAPVSGGFLINSFSVDPAVTGITLVGSASGNNVSGADLTVNLPGGTAIGDVVYAAFCIASASDINMQTVTSGYTKLADIKSNDDEDTNLGVFRKVQSSGPDTDVVFDGTGNANDGIAGVVYVLRGVNATPEDATTTTANGANTGAADPPSITTATNNAWVVPFGSGAHDSISAGPAGYSDFIGDAGDDTNRCAVGVARLLKATAGAENPGAFTITTSMTRSWAAATVAVRPQ